MPITVPKSPTNGLTAAIVASQVSRDSSGSPPRWPRSAPSAPAAPDCAADPSRPSAACRSRRPLQRPAPAGWPCTRWPSGHLLQAARLAEGAQESLVLAWPPCERRRFAQNHRPRVEAGDQQQHQYGHRLVPLFNHLHQRARIRRWVAGAAPLQPAVVRGKQQSKSAYTSVFTVSDAVTPSQVIDLDALRAPQLICSARARAIHAMLRSDRLSTGVAYILCRILCFSRRVGARI